MLRRDAAGRLRRRQRIGETHQLDQRMGPADQHPRIRRRAGEIPIDDRQRFPGPSGLAQDAALGEHRVAVVRVCRQHRVDFRQRLGNLAELAERAGRADMGGRVARTQSERPAEVGERLRRLVPVHEHHAAIDQRLRIGRLHRQRPAVGGERIVRAAEVPEDVAAVEMRRRVAGPERQRLVLGGQRIGEPAELLQRHAAVAVRLGEAAHQGDRRIELAQRVARPPLAQADVAHDVAADRVLERTAARLQHGGGLIQAPGLDVRHRGAEQALQAARGRLSRIVLVPVHAAGKLAEGGRMEQHQSRQSLGSSLRSPGTAGKWRASTTPTPATAPASPSARRPKRISPTSAAITPSHSA